MSDNLLRVHVRMNVRTGLPTKDETSETILRKLIANYFTSTSANLNVFCLQLYLKGWNIKSNFQMLIISED